MNKQERNSYQKWIRMHEAPETRALSYNPRFSVVIPVTNNSSYYLNTIGSVLSQSYDEYEVIILVSADLKYNDFLSEYRRNERILIIERKDLEIEDLLNTGIENAFGDYVVFLPCGDVMAPYALFEMAEKLNQNNNAELVYGDEDEIDPRSGRRNNPSFKPDWSPDLFMCTYYTGQFAAYRKSVLKETGGFVKGYGKHRFYELTFRFLEAAQNDSVVHVNDIIFHRNNIHSNDLPSPDLEKSMKEEVLKRRNLEGYPEYIKETDSFRVVYDTPGNPKVSIIILSKDNPLILKQCVDSIFEITNYDNFEIVVVDNGSERKNREEISKYLKSKDCRYIYGQYDFNYSKMCNIGTDNARGDYLLFLNDDTEVIQPDWIDRLLGHAMQEHVGAVGAKLFFPDSTLIQHMGVINTKNEPLHSFWKWDDDEPCYMWLNRLDQDNCAVTGACLMISKENFLKAGMFDEKMSVAYNDVDLCFRLIEQGLYNVVRQDVTLYHYESLSRKSDFSDDKKRLRLSREKQYLYFKHPKMRAGDPYYNNNISICGSDGVRFNTKNEDTQFFDEYGSFPCMNCYLEGVEVKVDQRVSVRGRVTFANGVQEDGYQLFLLMKNPYGVSRKARIELDDGILPEVAEQSVGFEVNLDINEVQMNTLPFRFGLQVTKNDETSYVFWEDREREPVFPNGFVRTYCDTSFSESFTFHPSRKEIRHYIDECNWDDDGLKLAGWAFCDYDNHYLYDRKVIITEEGSDTVELTPLDKERIDVAIMLPQCHYMLETGFECLVLPELLSGMRKPSVILRFVNVYDQNDVNDIVLKEF